MDEPDWAKILRYLHNHNGEIRRTAESTDQSEENPTNEEHEQALYEALREEVELENKHIDHIIETQKHLQNTGLANFQQRPKYAALQLTSDGFDVAHERELSQRNNRINHSLVFLTFILVLAQVVDVIPAEDWAKVTMGFTIMGGMLFVVYGTDMLEL